MQVAEKKDLPWSFVTSGAVLASFATGCWFVQTVLPASHRLAQRRRQRPWPTRLALRPGRYRRSEPGVPCVSSSQSRIRSLIGSSAFAADLSAVLGSAAGVARTGGAWGANLAGFLPQLKSFLGIGGSVQLGPGMATTWQAATLGQKLSSIGLLKT